VVAAIFECGVVSISFFFAFRVWTEIAGKLFGVAGTSEGLRVFAVISL
jgi:hypothetical protein